MTDYDYDGKEVAIIFNSTNNTYIDIKFIARNSFVVAPFQFLNSYKFVYNWKIVFFEALVLAVKKVVWMKFNFTDKKNIKIKMNGTFTSCEIKLSK